MSTGMEPSGDVQQIAVGLSKFQLRALQVVSFEDQNGQSIRDELEKYYPEKVHHGRVYSNLDTLVDVGVVDKKRKCPDNRTNTYSITEFGEYVLQFERRWCDELEVCQDD